MSEMYDFEGRSFDASVYDREYYEGNGNKSGYTDYMNARGIVRDQFAMVHEIMRNEFSDLSPKHLDVACAYGWGCQLMKERGWRTQGMDVSEWAIGKMKEQTDIDAQVADAVDGNYWSQFDDGELDLVTGVEFFEHVETADVNKIISEMSRVSKWGFFVINARTNPHTDVMCSHGDEGHLNNHNMSWWIGEFARYGELDFDKMFEFSKMAEQYNRDVHWHNRCAIIKFSKH